MTQSELIAEAFDEYVQEHYNWTGGGYYMIGFCRHNGDYVFTFVVDDENSWPEDETGPAKTKPPVPGQTTYGNDRRMFTVCFRMTEAAMSDGRDDIKVF